MDELLEFIDETFINLGGNMCSAHAISMEDLKHLELLTKIAIESKENQITETKLKSTNKIIRNRIIKLINYTLISLRIDIYTNKNINTTTCKKMVQKYKADKKILEDCLIWMSEK